MVYFAFFLKKIKKSQQSFCGSLIITHFTLLVLLCFCFYIVTKNKDRKKNHVTFDRKKNHVTFDRKKNHVTFDRKKNHDTFEIACFGHYT